MVEQLDELYREVILDHFKNPTHRGELPDAPIKIQGANPLCGDEMTFHLQVEGDRLTRVRFLGKGCAISQATASMLAVQLEGKTIAEAQQLIETMKALMQGQVPSSSVDLGDLEALAGVRKFPVRIKCAALSWNVVEQGLNAHQGAKGEGRREKVEGR